MKVTIIIPNYNGKHFIEPCLAALKKQTMKEFKVLVVDNCSIDGSQEYMKEKHPDIELISLDENYGFSYAVNIGIRRSHTPYVILLNNDTVVDEHYVEEMVKAIEIDKKVFSVSSKMIQMYHPDLIDSAGDLYTLVGWGICRGAGRTVDKYTKKERIFSACAGAAIYRRAVFEKIGYFDEIHFAYLEDIDVGYRARIHGYENIYCPTALVYHVGSGTSGSKYNSFKVKLSSRNSIYLNYKNMPVLQLLVNAVPLVVGYVVKYVFFCRKGFGGDYRDGIIEGLHTLSRCKKVKFKIRNTRNYLKIEWQLFVNTLLYAEDWMKRKLRSRVS